MSVLIDTIPIWLMIAAVGALLDLCAFYMIKEKRSRKENAGGGIAVFLAGMLILAAGIFLLVIGKSGTFGSYI